MKLNVREKHLIALALYAYMDAAPGDSEEIETLVGRIEAEESDHASH